MRLIPNRQTRLISRARARAHTHTHTRTHVVPRLDDSVLLTHKQKSAKTFTRDGYRYRDSNAISFVLTTTKHTARGPIFFQQEKNNNTEQQWNPENPLHED